MALLVWKGVFGKGPRKGVLCETQQLCSAESTIFIVFSAKHSLQCKLTKKTELYQKLGVVCQHTFLLFCVFCVLLFLVVLFLSLFAFLLLKALSLKSFSSSCSVFLAFLLFSLSNFHIYSCFFPSTPFWKTLFFFGGGGGGVLLSFILAFSFVNVCFIHSNKLSQNPLFKSNLL